MSDVMLLGVLRMPIDYAGGPLSPMAQFVSRAREAADRIEADAEEIAELKEAYALLFKEAGSLRSNVERLQSLLADVSKQTRHPDYDFPSCLQRELDESLRGWKTTSATTADPR